MIIGLVRHFKVDLPFRKSRYLPSEFNEQMTNYDSAPVLSNHVDLQNNNWEICYCSDLPRAITTAKTVYKNEILTTALLREVPLRAFTSRQWRLPSVLWHIGGRIAWRRNSKSQPETYIETKQRINKLLNLVSENDSSNILLVTHGFFMRLLVEELKKQGFKGELDVSPRNGKLYVFRKDQ